MTGSTSLSSVHSELSVVVKSKPPPSSKRFEIEEVEGGSCDCGEFIIVFISRRSISKSSRESAKRARDLDMGDISALSRLLFRLVVGAKVIRLRFDDFEEEVFD